MKKIFVIICFYILFFSILANVQLFLPQDAKKTGIINDILWKESSLNDEDIKNLSEIINYPHDDVASYALTVCIVHNVKNLAELLKSASQKERGNVPKIAAFVIELQRKGDLPPELEKYLKNKPESLCEVPIPDDYYRDIIVYTYLRQSRVSGKKIDIPKHVAWNFSQKALLEYAYMSEDKAWNFIYGEMCKKDMKPNMGNALCIALSAYSKIFFAEAVAAIQAQETSQITRKNLISYLARNYYRLSKEQVEQFKELTNVKSADK